MPRTRNTYSENLAILVEEINLAAQWDRPSILFTVHISNLGRDKSRKAFEDQLRKQGYKVILLDVDRDHSNPALLILQNPQDEQTVYFLSNLEWGGGEDGKEAYQALNIYREQFVENKTKVVFWLTIHEASNLARHAPDFWAFRHRVIEFASPRTHSSILLPSGVLAWHASADSDQLAELEAMILSREKILAELPDRPESLFSRVELIYNIGFLHWYSGDAALAMKWFENGLNSSQEAELINLRTMLLNGVANLKYESGDYPSATESYRELCNLDPDNKLTWMNLAFGQCNLGKKLEAESSATKALRIDPGNTDLWNKRGYLYLALGKLDEAEKYFLKSIETFPKNFHHQLSLAVCYHLIGLTEEAAQQFRKTRSLTSSKDVYLDICEQAILENDETAIQLFKNAIEEKTLSPVKLLRDPNLSILLDLTQFVVVD